MLDIDDQVQWIFIGRVSGKSGPDARIVDDQVGALVDGERAAVATTKIGMGNPHAMRQLKLVLHG